MRIHSLRSVAFRNLTGNLQELHPGLNLIVGANGQGKTNLLEAIALVSGRASFRTSEPAEAIQAGSTEAAIAATVVDGSNAETTLGVALSPEGRAHTVDGTRATRLEAARRLPVVFLTAADLGRLAGPPSARRRALDRAAARLEPDFARALTTYERARASKARLLAGRVAPDPDAVAAYEAALSEAGAIVARGRRAARAALERHLDDAARALGSPYPTLELRLESDLPAHGDDATFAEALRAGFAARRAEERAAKRCLVGPHRDDLVLTSGGTPVAARASAGETRTLLLAWTQAEMAVIARATGAPALLAFDDFDSEWDPAVLATFAAGLPEGIQILLTSAREEAVRGLPLPAGVLWRMQAGRATRDGILGAGRAQAARAAAG